MEYIQKYKSDFQEISFDKSNNILKTSWNTPINLSETIYRQELTKYFDLVEELAPQLILVDAVRAYYNILPETQDWINERNIEITKKINLLKMGWVVSSDLFSQVSFEQALDMVKDASPFNINYFDDIEEAEKWLLKILD